MRVLVTGGAGYIGSVLGDALIEAGHQVVVYDDLSTGHRDAVSPAATFIAGNILDRAAVTTALGGIDAVVHMAARSIIGGDSEETRRINVMGSRTLFDAMRDVGTPILVFSSSASVYGAAAKQPIEEDDPASPISTYGETKLEVERMLSSYAFRFLSLRYFNAAGATARCGERHEPETHLIPIVLRVAHARGVVTIHGDDHPTPDGTCIRDFVHVSDLAYAHLLAAESLARGGASARYNLGHGKGHSVLEVIRAAEAITGTSIATNVGPRRTGDPPVLVASAKRAERDLGWRATRDLRTTIEDAWKHSAR